MKDYWWNVRKVKKEKVPYCKSCDTTLEPSYGGDYYYHPRTRCKHDGRKLTGLEMMQRMPT